MPDLKLGAMFGLRVLRKCGAIFRAIGGAHSSFKDKIENESQSIHVRNSSLH